MKKRLVIYDLDGTLVDTRKDIALAVNHMMKVMNRKPLNQTTIEGFVGKGLRQLVKSCLGTEEEKEIEQGTKIYRNYYAEHMLDHTTLYPGALEVLDYFKECLQAVITNKPNPFSHEILKALGIAPYFREIVAGDSDYPKKPDPTAVLSIIQKGGVTPDETLFVGDSVIDIETGRNAGVDTVVITHGFESEEELQSAQPQMIVSDFTEFLKLMREKRW
jgi:phosphoglycolate phosphatase